MTRGTWIERGTMAAAAALLMFGALVAVSASEDTGVTLAQRSDGYVVVSQVNAYSHALQYGVRAGMIAINLNDQTLIRLPQYVYASAEPSVNPDTGEYPPPVPTGVDPAVPTRVNLPPAAVQALIDAPLRHLDAIAEVDLATWTADNRCCAVSIGDDGFSTVHESIVAVLGGFLLALCSAWWLGTGRAGESLRDLGLPLALAVSAPLAMAPLLLTWSPLLVALASMVVPLASLPLAWVLIERIDSPIDRRYAVLGSAGFAVGAVVFGVARIFAPPWQYPDFLTWVLSGGISALPGLLAAGPLLPGARRGQAEPGTEASASGRLLRSTELAAVGVTPAFALASGTAPYVVPIGIWIIALGIAGRFTIRPLARLASRAQLQRDLVVAATEAERARVAADIHDDALQELTLLVRRLDAAGDAEGATIARTVSDRLRAICGDLRLPILDDLGVGPALDWLVLRVERLAGGEVRLERSDGTRPPADVELAFFRVAQEALANAVKHGRPPIVVRYRSTDGTASLSIDDAGAGISPDARSKAEADGSHYGLLNMAQRAEAIGAILDIRRWPAGGTHVGLEWRRAR